LAIDKAFSAADVAAIRHQGIKQCCGANGTSWDKLFALSLLLHGIQEFFLRRDDSFTELVECRFQVGDYFFSDIVWDWWEKTDFPVDCSQDLFKS
jgi:hypothetical protein